MSLKKAVCLVLFAIATLGLPHALGCTQPPPDPPEPWIVNAGTVELYECGPKYEMYWIIFHDFTTTKTPAGTACGCALNTGGVIVSVTGAKLVDPVTGEPCPGFDFCRYPDVSNGAAILTGAGNFGGFLARINQTIPQGLKCDLWVCVLTKPGTTFDQLSNQLAQSGVLVAGEVDGKGLFSNPDHVAVTEIGRGMPGFISITEEPGVQPLRPLAVRDEWASEMEQ